MRTLINLPLWTNDWTRVDCDGNNYRGRCYMLTQRKRETEPTIELISKNLNALQHILAPYNRSRWVSVVTVITRQFHWNH